MRRRTDKLCLAAMILSLLVALVVGAIGFPALLKVNDLARENRALADRIVAENRERRDQSCALSERDHLADVKRLRRTYAYLRRLPRDEWGTNLTREVVRGLPDLEREARVDVAPAFCDEPNIGLPEPDPKLPARRNFDRLLERG